MVQNNRSPESSETPSTIIDNNVTEMARLIDLHAILARTREVLFPGYNDTTAIHYVLNIACGPGGWTLDVAFEHPKVEVIGVDMNPAMIKYASALAHSQGLQNAHFRTMDVLKHLDFPDNTFDVVNAHCMSSSMPTSAWPALLQDCMRILRPGGVLYLLEAETPITNSGICERVGALLARVKHQADGYTLINDESPVAITPLLGPFLRQAGYRNIQHKAYAIDYAKGAEAYEGCYDNFTVELQLLKPFLLEAEVLTEEEFDKLYRDFTIAMLVDGFCGIWYWLSIWGVKPSLPENKSNPL
ncbi:MAG TPA: methyltransferase domain-containing protein [Ktedonosporobacter sp.]|jgi:ubiquinone/menaquinone biosynthesis C-methylase UbiE|nr:methyltransferase domain-containing protein [Ktedonosporobacter sp.]